MDRGAWWATVQGFAESGMREWLSAHTQQMLSPWQSTWHTRYPCCLSFLRELVPKELSVEQEAGHMQPKGGAFTLELESTCFAWILWWAMIPLHPHFKQLMKRAFLAISWMLPNITEHWWWQVGCCEIQFALIRPEAGKHSVGLRGVCPPPHASIRQEETRSGSELAEASAFQWFLKGAHSELQNQWLMTNPE